MQSEIMDKEKGGGASTPPLYLSATQWLSPAISARCSQDPLRHFVALLPDEGGFQASAGASGFTQVTPSH